MAIRKTFSFTRDDVVEWIEKHGNSKYIVQLVIEDMGREGFVTKGEVIRLIEERMGNGGVDNKIDEEIKNSAFGLLNWK